jgi:hypothetical protein
MHVGAHLTRLEANDLIRLVQLHPEVEYLFRHALVQQAAYGSLVKGDRRLLHQTVGETLERLHAAERASPELAPLLAEHFAQAGDPARALPYYTAAGQAAANRYANAEAIHLFGRALEMAHALTGLDDQIVDLCLRRGRALELNAQDAEALRNYEALEAWAAARGNRRAELAALAARATIYVKPAIEQNQSLGYELAQRALSVARELGDRPAEAKALWNLLLHHITVGEAQAALASGEQALAIARELDLREQTAYVLTDLLKVYYQVNQTERAKAVLSEARALWRELGKLNMLADNLATTGMMQAMAGEFEAALALSGEARQVSRAIGALWNEAYSYYMVDVVHFERGEIGAAIEAAQTARRLAEQAGFSEGRNQADFDLALIYSFMGDLPQAIELASSLRARVRATAGGSYRWPGLDGFLAWQHLQAGRLAEAQATLTEAGLGADMSQVWTQFISELVLVGMAVAELALARGEALQALALADQVSEALRAASTRLFLVDMIMLRARALWAAGRAAEAEAAWEAARAEAEALGSRRSLWSILAALARLAEGRGEQATAADLWRQAADIVDYIAAHAGSAALAETFRGRAEVREVLGKL